MTEDDRLSEEAYERAMQTHYESPRKMLERIEAKLNWLRWRMRWGEQGKVIYDEETGYPVGWQPADIGPEPPWPGDESVESS